MARRGGGDALLVPVELAQAYQGRLVFSGGGIGSRLGRLGGDVFVDGLCLPGIRLGQLLGFLDPARVAGRHCGCVCVLRADGRVRRRRRSV